VVNAVGKAFFSQSLYKTPYFVSILKCLASMAKFNRGGNFIAFVEGKLLHVWSIFLAKEDMKIHHYRTYGYCHRTITCLDWSENSDWIVSGSEDLVIRLFSMDPIKGYQITNLIGHKDLIVGVFFSNSGTLSYNQQILSISKDGVLLTWTCEFGNPRIASSPLFSWGWRLTNRFMLTHSVAKMTSVNYQKTLAILVAGFSDGTVELYSLPNHIKILTLHVAKVPITAVSFLNTGNWLVLGCARSAQMSVFEWRSNLCILNQRGHLGFLTAIAYSSSATYFATGSSCGEGKVWYAESGRCVASYNKHTRLVTGIKFLSTSENIVASSSLDGTVRLFDIANKKNFRTFIPPTKTQLISIAVDKSGDIICAGGKEEFSIFLWSLNENKLLQILTGHRGPISSLVYDPESDLVVSGSWDCTIRIWKMLGIRELKDIIHEEHEVTALAIRPDKRQLALATSDGSLYFRDSKDFGLKAELNSIRISDMPRNVNSNSCYPTLHASSLSFSHDGAYLLAGCSKNHAFLFNTVNNITLQKYINTSSKEIENPKESIACVIFCPRGYNFCITSYEGVLSYCSMPSDYLIKACQKSPIEKELKHRKNLGSIYYTLLLSLRLNDTGLIRSLVCSTSSRGVVALCQDIPVFGKLKLFLHLGLMLTSSTNMEHLMRWLYNLSSRNSQNPELSSPHSNKIIRLLAKVISHVELNFCTLIDHNKNLIDLFSN
jgi:periodic tryptophan protein 2